MSTVDYKNKYLKYKKKYIDFKKIQEINNLKGGYNNIDIDTTTTDFINKNTINNRCLLLNSNYNPDVNQIKKYFELLDKLLVCSDFSINIEFLNIFYEYIFNSGCDNVNFINGDTNYTIGKTVATTDNSEISLLNKKESNPENPNLPKTLILKKYNGITAKLINYLSLEIGHIIRNPERSFIPSFQNNYYTMTMGQFNKINYNNIDHEDLIKTNTKNNRFDIKNYDYDYLYLSCKNNNAINDFIINIILQKIIHDNKFPDNFVKYHNLYISKDSTGTDCYYLIMETLNGTVKDLYDNEISSEYSPEDKVLLFKYISIIVLHQVETLLKYLKQKQFIFNHTDLKLENVFYKKEIVDSELDTIIVQKYKKSKSSDSFVITKSVDSVYNLFEISDGVIYKFKFLIADFDKSQITYKNIRFYNNSSRFNSQGAIKDYINSSGIFKNFNETYLFNVEQEEGPDDLINVNKVDKHEYKIIRPEVFSSMYFISGKNIETEQLILRYSMFPYYSTFDMQSFIISLFTLKIFDFSVSKLNLQELSNSSTEDDCNQKLNSIFSKYFKNWLIVYKIYKDTKWSNITGKADTELYCQNFGFLLKPLIDNKAVEPIFYFFDYNSAVSIIPNKTSYVDKLFITYNYHKIIVSIPIKVNTLNTKTFRGFDNTTFLAKTDDVLGKYRSIGFNGVFMTQLDEILNDIENNLNIKYNCNYSSEDRWIVKTNRFSSKHVLYTCFNEYDYIFVESTLDEEKNRIIKFIADNFFSSMS